MGLIIDLIEVFDIDINMCSMMLTQSGSRLLLGFLKVQCSALV